MTVWGEIKLAAFVGVCLYLGVSLLMWFYTLGIPVLWCVLITVPYIFYGLAGLTWLEDWLGSKGWWN